MTEKLSASSFTNSAFSTDSIVDAAVTAEKLNLSSVTLDKLDANVISRLSSSVKIQTIFNPAGTANIAGGETVWIHGIGFTPNSVVYVDKTGCATTFVDAYKIYFTTPPAAAGSYTVFVENYDGTVGSRINGITYTAPAGLVTWTGANVLPVATTGSSYSYQLSATGTGTISYSIRAGSPGLIPGLTLNSNGLITGTSLWVSDANIAANPSSANVVFRATATDSLGNLADRDFIIPNRGGVMLFSQTPQLNSLRNVVGTVAGETVSLTGTGFKTNANVTVGTTVYTPTISNATFISFTTVNTAAGSYTLRVNNPDGTFSNSLSLTFAYRPSWAANAATYTANLIYAVEETNVSTYMSVNTLSSISYSITSGSLPAGLTLFSSNGLIAGTLTGDTSVGNYTFGINGTSVEGFVLGERLFTANVFSKIKIYSVTYANLLLAANTGGNQIITVTGMNFIPNSRVIISNILQNTTFISPTTLTFTTQSRTSGNYVIGVRNYNLSNNYVITANGIYSFSAIDSTVNVSIKMWGAGGGNSSAGSTGGAGGFSTGNISVLSSTMYTVIVGQRGGPFFAGRTIIGNGGTGSQGPSSWSGSGGGFTGIFLGTAGGISQETAILMAGGGGGAGSWQFGGGANGGSGGGLIGQTGVSGTYVGQTNSGGGGGTQLAGGIGGIDTVNISQGGNGSAFYGGNAAAIVPFGSRAGGGGGGYFGGGAGGGYAGNSGAGGGGSGYINGNLVVGGSTQTGSFAVPFDDVNSSLRGISGSANTDGAVAFSTISGLQISGGQFVTVLDLLGASANISFRYSSPPNWVTATGNIGIGTEDSTFLANITGNSDSALTYSILSGSLPPNLSLFAANGTITGTLASNTSVGFWNFTAVVTDAENQTAFRDFNITVLSRPRITSIVYPTAVPVLKSSLSQTVGIVGNAFVNGATVFIGNIAQTTTVVNSTFISFTTNSSTPSGNLSLAVRNPSGARSSNITVRFNPVMTWVSRGNLIAYGFFTGDTAENFTTRLVANSQSAVTYSIVGTQPNNIQVFSNGLIVGTANSLSSVSVSSLANYYLNDQDIFYDTAFVPTFFTAQAVNTDLDVLTANFTMLFVGRPTITNVRTVIGGNITNLSIAHSDGSDTMLITGTNFRNKARLYVGNTIVTTTQFSSNSCLFVAPPFLPGNVAIYVVNDDGTSAASTITYVDTARVASADNFYTLFAARNFSANVGASIRSSVPVTYSIQGRLSPNLVLKTFPDITSAYINDYDLIPTATVVSGVVDTFLDYTTVVGEVAYTTPGTYSFTVPNNVTSISVVAVGGGASPNQTNVAIPVAGGAGGLGWKNNIPVIPGQSYTVVVGAGGAGNATASTGNDGGDSYFLIGPGNMVLGGGGSRFGPGGRYGGDGGGNGGSGGQGNSAGSGGAGGYTGNGGNGGTGSHNQTNASHGLPGSGGGGGGGAAQWRTNNGGDFWYPGGTGGGVGIFGQGANGSGGLSQWYNYGPPVYAVVSNGYGGKGGSGGADGIVGTGYSVWYNPNPGMNGVQYGSGATAGVQQGAGPGTGGGGAVRIIWGKGRSFPALNTGANLTLPNVTDTLRSSYTFGANSFTLTATDQYGKSITSNHTIYEINSPVVGSLWLKHFYAPGYDIPTTGSLNSPGNIAIETNSSEFGAVVIGNALTSATTVFIGNTSVASYIFPNASMMTFSFPNVTTIGTTTLTIRHYEQVLYRANIIYFTPPTGNILFYTATSGPTGQGAGAGISWVAPANVYYVHAAAIGGGASAGTGPYGSGGGGGGLGWRNYIPVVPGNSYDVVVGPGGIAPTSFATVPCTSGRNGGDSYFISNTTVMGGGGLTQIGCNIGGIGGGFVGSGGGRGGNGGGWQIVQGGECSGGGGAAGTFNGNGSPGGMGSGTTTTTQVTFSTAGLYTWTAPATANFATVYIWGAGGAGGRVGGWSFGSQGGGGGAAYGNIFLTPGATYGITVGEGGNFNTGTTPTVGNGGGACPTGADNSYGGGGGGYSGIFLGNIRTQSTAILIAGGGGGGGSSRAGTGNQGGAGGGIIGQDGVSAYDNKPGYRGRRGLQTSAAFNSVTDGTASGGGEQGPLQGGGTRLNSYGGAGGGGWYGGSSGGYSEPNTMAGGGGGSGYVNPNIVVNGRLFTGNLAIAGDSTNGLRGTAGNGGAVGTAGTSGAVIIVWTEFIPTPDGISGGGAGGGGGNNPAGNSAGGGSGGGGGGTGLLYGQSVNADGTQTASGGGAGGSLGTAGTSGSSGASGIFYGGAGGFPGGGGGAGAKNNCLGGAGADGAVRLIWGPGVRWPLTNTR